MQPIYTNFQQQLNRFSAGYFAVDMQSVHASKVQEVHNPTASLAVRFFLAAFCSGFPQGVLLMCGYAAHTEKDFVLGFWLGFVMQWNILAEY
jgi:hypothetical protein